MDITAKTKNGKAYFEFAFSEDIHINGQEPVLLRIKDGESREVWSCLYPLWEEEPAQGILLHPHLWNGLEEPYLYGVEAHFTDKSGKIVESLQKSLAFYTFEEIAGKGWFLNGKPFELRAVCWDVEKAEGVRTMLKQLQVMGANAIYIPQNQKEKAEELAQLCAKAGILVLTEGEIVGPSCSQLFSSEFLTLTDTYYDYKAKWSREPFVHICKSSIKKQENGNFALTVYSNQKRIALYVDGVLFEFRNGGQEYFFEEIPIRKYPAVLTAEAGECNTAVTIYEGSQNFHRTVTFS